jgi:hypothetical protein
MFSIMKKTIFLVYRWHWITGHSYIFMVLYWMELQLLFWRSSFLSDFSRFLGNYWETQSEPVLYCSNHSRFGKKI